MANPKTITHTYLILLRGINVGGKNLVSMASLKLCLEGLGYANVTTFIASGNVIVQSTKSPRAIKTQIEQTLPKKFKLHSGLIKVLVVSRQQLQSVIDRQPKNFGQQSKKYHSDVIFLMDITVAQALPVFTPRPGVDTIWPGPGVIYSQRLSAQRTKSRLNRMMSSPLYKFMTIRTWNTTTSLLRMMQSMDGKKRLT